MKLRILYLLVIMFVAANYQAALGQQVQYSPTLDLYMSGSGGAWFDKSNAFLDSMIKNNMAQQQMQRLMFNQMMIDSMVMENAGKRRIAAGQATTRFTPSPQNSIAEQWAANAQTAEEKQQIRQTVSLAVQTFNEALKKKRLTPYDAADGKALAFILAYLAYNDEDPGAARLAKMREFMRNATLKSAVEQGLSDAEKQRFYEKRAFQTMLAVRAYQQSKQPGITAQEKEAAQTLAKKSAAEVLKVMWTGDVSKMGLSNSGNGFADRGTAIIESGKATTTFTRSNTVLSTAELAKLYKTDEQEIESLLNEFDLEVKRRGGATNDAAWVNAVAFAFAYEVYSQNKVKLNQAQLNWVLKEMQKDMLEASFYQAFTNEEKQKYYESVALQTMVVYDVYRRTNDDGVRVNAKERLNDIFNPRKLDDYSLTSTGFVKKQ